MEIWIIGSEIYWNVHIKQLGSQEKMSGGSSVPLNNEMPMFL